MPSKVHFSNIKETIINELRKSKTEIEIAVAWITEPEIIQELNNCLKRRVSLKIISVNDKVNGIDNFQKLYYNKAQIRLATKKLMHNKFCIIDNHTLISGSFNWTRNASKNHENITVSINDRNLLENFSKEFENLWKKCQNFDSQLAITNSFLSGLNEYFEDFYYSIKYNNEIPYFLNLNENRFNHGITFKESIQSSRLEKQLAEEFLSKYFFIENEKKEYDSIKYIFYKLTRLDFSELNKALNNKLKLSATVFSDLLPRNYKTKDKHISEVKWAISSPELFQSKVLYQITDKTVSSNPNKTISLTLGNGNYVIKNNSKDALKILNNEGNLIEFQNQQKLFATDKSGWFCKILNSKMFIAYLKIGPGSNFEVASVYNNLGIPLTKPIFRNTDCLTPSTPNICTLREYALLYHNKGTSHVRYCRPQTDEFVFKKWDIDGHKGTVHSDYKNYSKNTWHSQGKMDFNPDTNLFYYSNVSGHLFLAIFLSKMDLLVNDFNSVLKAYKTKSASIETNSGKM